MEFPNGRCDEHEDHGIERRERVQAQLDLRAVRAAGEVKVEKQFLNPARKTIA